MSEGAHRYVLAGDLGSSGCKTILWRDDGTVVAAATREIATRYPAPGGVEQDPEEWWHAFAATTREVLARGAVDAAHIAAVAVVGVTHNAVLLDAHGEPLLPCVLLFDVRSRLQCERLAGTFGPALFRELAQNDLSPMWTLPQLLWLRENRPEAWSRTSRLVFQKDFVRQKLTGGEAQTDEIDAAGSLLWDAERRAWIGPFLDAAGVPASWLPAVRAPTEIAGKVGPEGSRLTGLLTGTPVVTGTTDTAAELLGCGALSPGEGFVKLASVGRIAMVHDSPVLRPHVINYRHVLPGRWYPGTSCKHAASAYKWLRDALCSTEERQRPDSFQQLDAAAADAPPGASGVLFRPHLSGQWAPHFDDNLRASFTGLSLSTRRGHLARAVLEGVGFALRDALEDFERQVGRRISRLRLMGEGSRSSLWQEIIASVLDRELSLPRQTGAAYGAALVGAIGAGLVEPRENPLRALCGEPAGISPRPNWVGVYEERFEEYRSTQENV